MWQGRTVAVDVPARSIATVSLDKDAIDYYRNSDGMYPLLTNDNTLTPAQVPAAQKGQPTIEKRFEQTKTGRFERPTYRFVARTGEGVDHHQDDPSTTKDGESSHEDGEK